MPKEIPSKEKLAEFKKMTGEMTTARLDIFSANVTRYAEVLGAYRTALQKSGFSAEESMQIILRAAEQPSRGPMFGGRRAATGAAVVGHR